MSNKKNLPALRERREFLERPDVMEQLHLAAAKGVDVDRLVRTALTLASKTPKLLECTPTSWVVALQQSAALGIPPTGELGKAYLIPRWNRNVNANEVNFQLGYRGLIELVRRSPEIRNVTAELVYEGDRFVYAKGLNPVLDHVPILTEDERPIVAAYAICWWANGHTDFEVMNRAQIDRIARSSDSYGKKGSPWDAHYGEMARKTVLRRIVKYLPLTVDIEAHIVADMDADDIRPGRVASDPTKALNEALRPPEPLALEAETVEEEELVVETAPPDPHGEPEVDEAYRGELDPERDLFA